MLSLPGNEEVASINPLVGETNDGYPNDIRGRHISREDVFASIKNAKPGPVEEGSVGAGTGTVAFGFKGGIGTSSRRLPESLGGYTVGVPISVEYYQSRVSPSAENWGSTTCESTSRAERKSWG